MKTVIEMARESWLDIYGLGKDHASFVEALERFAEIVRDDERRKRPQILKDGEMELTLRREHQGAVYGVRRRFSAQEVFYGPDKIVEMAAEQMDAEIRRSINKATGEIECKS